MRIWLVLLLFPIVTSCSLFTSEDKDTAELHLRIGTSYLMNGDYPQALNELLIAESLDPENAVIQNNLGLAYMVRDRYELAENHIRNALKINSSYSDARNNLSKVLIERGQYNEALKEAKKVMEDLTYSFPEKPLINSGIAEFKLGQFSKSRETFLRAIEIQRDNCLAHSYYGRSLYELRDYKKASEALDKAVGFCQRSQFDEPVYYGALSYYQLGDRVKSESRFEQILKMYPNGQYSDKAKSMLEVMRK